MTGVSLQRCFILRGGGGIGPVVVEALSREKPHHRDGGVMTCMRWDGATLDLSGCGHRVEKNWVKT